VTAGALVQAALTASADELLRCDAPLRQGEYAEAVHDARVAVRRLRSDLRALVPALDAAWASALREKMRWLGDELGAARDAGVLLERLERDLKELREGDAAPARAALEPWAAARDAAYARVGELVREPRYVALLDEIVAAARAPLPGERAGDDACELAAAVMRDAWKSLRKAVRRRSRPATDLELHRIRIKAKRVRYTAEAVVPAIGKRARTFARKVEALQTVLGEQHDAVVVHERLQQAAGSGEHAFVTGELAALEREAALRARRRWRKAWRAAARRKHRFWTTL
jgi:CHAD domain-containing protein